MDLPATIGMDSIECWLSEYQEQMVFIATPEKYTILKELALREGVLIHKLGIIQSTRNSCITFQNTRSDTIYKFNYNDINNKFNLNNYSHNLQDIAKYTLPNQLQSLQPLPQPLLDLESFKNYHNCNEDSDDKCRESLLERSFKFHLTNKIDRCVSGCVVQQSCIGPYSIPLSNYSIIRFTPTSPNGILSAIGENIYIGQSIELWINKTICELICNLAAVPNIDLSKIKLSGNWMLNAKHIPSLTVLYHGVQHLVKTLKLLRLSIDGGKDSLTMSMEKPNGVINSPPTLVLTSYSLVLEDAIENRISPLLFTSINTSMYFIDMLALLSSVLSVSSVDLFIDEFMKIQLMISNKQILALHDGSNVMDILEEMTVVSGIDIIKKNLPSNNCIFKNHYLVVQIPNEFTSLLSNQWKYIAKYSNDQSITFIETHTFIPLENIFNQRNTISLEMDKCAFQYEVPYIPMYYLWPNQTNNTLMHMIKHYKDKNIKIAIIRDEGSNSHKEMAAAFLQFEGIHCYDYTINQLIYDSGARESILECNGYVFVGGFAYGDILGSGKATAMIMKTRLQSLWDNIFQDNSKFVLGICNGCQILIEYGLFGNNVSMKHNKSNKFECRYLPVRYKLPISLTEIQIGIWVSHGEGRFSLNNNWMDNIEILGQYISSKYPINPNGSDQNAIGIKSKYQNHYVIMPHPERTLFKWQCEWIPKKEKNKYSGPYTPWIEFFYNLLLFIR
jgi:phosphoribosylformylglycinamidine synthase